MEKAQCCVVASELVKGRVYFGKEWSLRSLSHHVWVAEKGYSACAFCVLIMVGREENRRCFGSECSFWVVSCVYVS